MTHTMIRAAARTGLALMLALAFTALAATAQANPANQSAPWKLNGNGFPGDVTVQQAPDGTLSGGMYGDPLTGYYAPGERIGVWLRGPAGRPIQAFIGQASADGINFSGRFYALNASNSGGSPARNVFAFSAQRAAPAAPGNPGVPASAAGPASVAGAHQINGNGFVGPLQLNQAPDGTLTGTIYGQMLEGHYASGTGSIALIRYSGPAQPFQLFVGNVTPQGMRGEFYALNGGAGASLQRMRYEWSATSSPPAAAGAFIGPGGRPAQTSGVALLPALPPQPQPPVTASDGPPRLQHEIVHGPETRSGPGESTSTYADCPSGKTALSVGYRVRAVSNTAADAINGVEIGAVFPHLGRGEFRIKNVNVFEPVMIQAIVICIRSHPSIQYREQVVNEYGYSNVRYMPCFPGERLVGGGFWRLSWGTHPTVYAPRMVRLQKNGPVEAVWMVSLIDTDSFGHDTFKTRAVCVPSSWVPGWELLDQNTVASLGPRAAAIITANCVNGTKVLAAGVESILGGHEFVSAALAPSASNPLQWFSTVLNRAVIQQYRTQMRMSIICARLE